MVDVISMDRQILQPLPAFGNRVSRTTHRQLDLEARDVEDMSTFFLQNGYALWVKDRNSVWLEIFKDVTEFCRSFNQSTVKWYEYDAHGSACPEQDSPFDSIRT